MTAPVPDRASSIPSRAASCAYRPPRTGTRMRLARAGRPFTTARSHGGCRRIASIVVPRTSQPGRRQPTTSRSGRSVAQASRIASQATRATVTRLRRWRPGSSLVNASSARRRARASGCADASVASPVTSIADASTTSPSPASAAAVSRSPLSRSGSLIATTTFMRSLQARAGPRVRRGHETTPSLARVSGNEAPVPRAIVRSRRR